MATRANKRDIYDAPSAVDSTAKRARRAPATPKTPNDGARVELAPRTPCDGDRFDSPATPKTTRAKENDVLKRCDAENDARAMDSAPGRVGILSRHFRLFSKLLAPNDASTRATAEREIRELKAQLREAHDRAEVLSEDKRMAEKMARKMDAERAQMASEQVAVQKTVSELGRELLETAKESWSLRSELARKDAHIASLLARKQKKGGAKSSNIKAATEFILDYFSAKRCDSVGMDELMRVKPSNISAEDFFAALAERITDTANQTASHMVVVHQI
jgi:hypothetical protein